MVTKPFELLQVELVVVSITEGEVDGDTVTEIVAEQPFADVTVTAYDPGERLLAADDVTPLLHWYT